MLGSTVSQSRTSYIPRNAMESQTQGTCTVQRSLYLVSREYGRLDSGCLCVSTCQAAISKHEHFGHVDLAAFLGSYSWPAGGGGRGASKGVPQKEEEEEEEERKAEDGWLVYFRIGYCRCGPLWAKGCGRSCRTRFLQGQKTKKTEKRVQ